MIELVCPRCGIHHQLTEAAYKKRNERKDEQLTRCRDCYEKRNRTDGNAIWANYLAAIENSSQLH